MSLPKGVQMKPEWKPFERNDSWTLLEQVKTFILAFTLLPLRIISTILLLSWYRVFVAIGLIGVDDLTKPFAPWRRRWFVEMGQPVARFLCVILGFYKIKINGSPLLDGPNGRANVIIMNHSSWMDIFLVMAIADGIPGFVAKRETMQIPYIGFKSQVWQGLYVDNRISANANSVATQVSERAKRDDMPPITIFPEGTTTNGKALITFRSGGFVGGHPVKPVVVSYPAKNFSPTWESIGGLTHIFRVLTQIQNHVEVTWLPVYYPSEEEKKDPKLYANNVRKVLSKALQIPMVESSFADKVDYHVAIGHRKPVTTNAAPTNEVKKDN